MSRARTTFDPGRLASLVARPGIDPRRWVILAQVKQASYVARRGYFASVVGIPLGEEFTAQVGAGYAGNGFGAYAGPKEGDLVVVLFTEGDPSALPVIVTRLWNGADPPPADGSDEENEIPTDDVLLRVAPGDHLRVRVSGGGGVTVIAEGDGDVVLAAEGTGKVKLGTSGLQPATLGTANQNVLNNHETRIAALEASIGAFITAFGTHTHVLTVTGVTPGVGVGAGTATPPTGFSPPAPVPATAPETRAVDTEVK